MAATVAVGGHTHVSEFRMDLRHARAPCALHLNTREETKMNRRHLLAVPAALGLSVMLLPAAGIAQQKSIKDQLVGTWTVVSWEQTRPDGTKTERFGANPKGVNVFTPDGRFFLMFARADLPRIASNDPRTPTPEEAKAIATGTIAYFGSYTVDEASKTMTLRLESSTLPNQLGVDQKRTIVSLTADELKYTNPNPVIGGKIDVTFRRAAAATN
jgi:Lipocalin-like domain